MMDSFILTLAMRWLPSSDAFSALLVCKEWRDALLAEETEGELWKQICRNTFPLATEAVIQGNADVNAINFRHLIASFVRRDGFDDLEDPPREGIVPATLRPEDVFATIQLFRKLRDGDKRRRVELASWVCPFVGDPEEGALAPIPENERKVVITGANPFWDSEMLQKWSEHRGGKSPFCYAATDVLGSDWCGANTRNQTTVARVTLFRRDNMKSVCITDVELTGLCQVYERNDDWETVVADFWEKDGVLHLTNNDSGRNARLLMHHHGYKGIVFDGHIILQVDLPVPGSDEEPEWLKNYRRPNPDGQWFPPSDIDKEALSSIPSFDFKVTEFNLDFQAVSWEHEYFSDCFESQGDLMIAVEGLDWN